MSKMHVRVRTLVIAAALVIPGAAQAQAGPDLTLARGWSAINAIVSSAALKDHSTHWVVPAESCTRHSRTVIACDWLFVGPHALCLGTAQARLSGGRVRATVLSRECYDPVTGEPLE